jgi:hypothetical protein
LSLSAIFFDENIMEKLDLTKTYKTYFTAKAMPALIEIERANYISITGKGDPSHKAFTERLETLYPVTYALKFHFKAKNQDFVVSKLEGLWWFDEKKYPNKTIANSSTDVPRSEWEYRLLIRLPDFVTKKDFDKAIETVVEKKNTELTHELEFFTMAEGKCVQMLHVGPYSTEPETLKQIGSFMEANKLTRNGLHHEIYLSDFRKTKSEKLKTILREPVR